MEPAFTNIGIICKGANASIFSPPQYILLFQKSYHSQPSGKYTYLDWTSDSRTGHTIKEGPNMYWS